MSIFQKLKDDIQLNTNSIEIIKKNEPNFGIVQLLNGSLIVLNTNCTPFSLVYLTYLQPTNESGILSISDVQDGQFTIHSSNAQDSSLVQWLLYNYSNVVLPTVITLNIEINPFAPYFICQGEIVNGSLISQLGFVWSQTNTLPTLNDNIENVNIQNGMGVYTSREFLVLPPYTLTYVRSFITNPLGTTYGNVITGKANICLAKGTKIALSDGTDKFIENICYSDSLLVWNFDKGDFDVSYPLWIKKVEKTDHYNVLQFDNGVVLETINQHRIFNKERGAFTYPMTEDTPIGTITFFINGSYTRLINKKIIHEPIDYYNIITNYHMNMFANGILTSCRYNNIYPIKDMKFVKHDKTSLIRPYCDMKYFTGLRLAEQVIPINDTLQYIIRLEKKSL